MPLSVTDQFYSFDPANPPDPGDPVTITFLTVVDIDDDGPIDYIENGIPGGLPFTSSWPGDTVTINVPGVGNVTYTGTTLYLATGERVFTPTDDQILAEGTFVSATYVIVQGPLPIDSLGPPCFLPGTEISTPSGPQKIEDIRAGDLVCTVDDGASPVVLVRHRIIPAEHLDAQPKHAPVRIPRAAFMANASGEDLCVSPQHRMLIRSEIVQRMFGTPEVLVPAAQLVGFFGIERFEPQTSFHYLHLVLPKHSIVEANGIKTESLFMSRSVVADFSRFEIVTAMAELAPSEFYAARPARPFVRGRKLKQLLRRHEKNGIRLWDGAPSELFQAA